MIIGVTIGQISFLYITSFLSKHKANATELHPKVRPTCYYLIMEMDGYKGISCTHFLLNSIILRRRSRLILYSVKFSREEYTIHHKVGVCPYTFCLILSTCDPSRFPHHHPFYLFQLNLQHYPVFHNFHHHIFANIYIALNHSQVVKFLPWPKAAVHLAWVCKLSIL